MASRVQPVDTNVSPSQVPSSKLIPLKPIPGSYGIPFLSPIKDRLEFYYGTGGQNNFFKSRIDRYGSTVFRVNVPPGPFMSSNPQAVALLDAKSFPVLFDITKVEKRDVLTGTYMSSTSLTGGFRVCPYLDPSEPRHALVKQLLISLLASRKSHIIPTFSSAYSVLFTTMEAQLAVSSTATSNFNKLNGIAALDFLGDAYFGAPSIGSEGSSNADKWIFLQIYPMITLGLPKLLEEIFLHSFSLPSFLVKSNYNALYEYIKKAAGTVLDDAEKLGISRDEACHNLVFATVFNSYGGLKVLLPGILYWLARSEPELHYRLAKEVRASVKATGGEMTLEAVERMELVQSVVYEVLRMDPPVKYQYGKAKMDLMIESHDATYQVKKGEMMFGYQPFATRDTRVFPNGEKFLGDRFVGKEGRNLLKYVLWSNGPETENPTVGNKQCPGKDLVLLVGRLLVAEFFLRYDTFTAEIGTVLFTAAQVTVTSLTKATN